MRIGIVAVHGVIPQAKYGFQDQIAEELRDHLNATGNYGGPWTTTVVKRESPSTSKVDVGNQPTISRVAKGDTEYFDVHEAYWSPLDKNVTTTAKVLYWLLQTVFLPINDTARFMASRAKVRWDVGTVAVIALATAVLWALALVGLTWGLGAAHIILGTERGADHPSLLSFDSGMLTGAFGAFAHPLSILGGLAPLAILALVVGGVGAFFGFQTARALWNLHSNWKRLQSDPIQKTSRWIAIVVLGVLSAAGLIVGFFLHMPNDRHLGIAAIAIILSVGMFEGGRLLANWFLPNFFGDVQIYTTRDANNTFYTLRESILNLVTEKIVDVVANKPAGKDYDCVYVLAHSLGSTIALDALMRIYNTQPSPPVSAKNWERIRGFITFGTSLEKTKYFFNAWNPTVSQSYDEWQDDLYGPLFTKEAGELKKKNGPGVGIFWMNYWYFTDFVSNEIVSYRSYVNVGAPMDTARANRSKAMVAAMASTVPIGGRAVARNCELPDTLFSLRPGKKFHPVTHGDYLGDAAFWNGRILDKDTGKRDLGALDILTSCVGCKDEPGTAKATAAATPIGPVGAGLRENARFEEPRDDERPEAQPMPDADVATEPDPSLHSFEPLTSEEARTTRGVYEPGEPGKKP